MKNLFTMLILCISAIGFSQSKSNYSTSVNKDTMISDVSISVTVDSAEDVESTFKIDDLKNILETSSDGETMSFEIICNGERMSNGEKSTLSYKVEGDSENINEFLKSIKKIRKAAIKYYKNKS